MKRITLALIVGLWCDRRPSGEFDILSHDIFRPTDPWRRRSEWGLVHQGPRVNATDFAPDTIGDGLLLPSPRTTHSATGFT